MYFCSWCEDIVRAIPKQAVEILPSNSSGKKRTGRLFIWDDRAHLLTDKLPEPEEFESGLSFNDDDTKFRWRKPKVKSEAPAATAAPVPADPMIEALVEVVADSPDAQQAKFSDDVLNQWRQDAEAARNTPLVVKPSEPTPVVEPVQHRSGIITARNDQGRYLFIEDSESGIRVFAHYNETHRPHNHFCLFAPGQSVVFDVGEDPSRGLNVRLVETPVLPEIETATVSYWNPQKQYGFCRRPCFCELFLSGENVVTEGVITKNAEIRFRPIEQPNRCIATEIEIFQPDPEPTAFGQALNQALQAVQN